MAAATMRNRMKEYLILVDRLNYSFRYILRYRTSSLLVDLEYILLLDDAEVVLISVYFVKMVRVLLQAFDELQIVGNDYQLQSPSAYFD